MCLAYRVPTLRGISLLAYIISKKKGRAPTLSDTSKSFFQFRLAAGTLSPWRGRRPRFHDITLSGVLTSNSCLTARSAFPYETEKAAAFPVAKHIDFSPRTLFLLGGHRYWCSEDHVSSEVSMSIKKCPEYLLGRLSPPLELSCSMCLAMAKVRRNPETCKRFRDYFSILCEKNSR